MTLSFEETLERFKADYSKLYDTDSRGNITARWDGGWDQLVDIHSSEEDRAKFVWWALEHGVEDGRLAGHVAAALELDANTEAAMAFLSKMEIQDPYGFTENSFFWRGHPFVGTWRGSPLWTPGAERLVQALVALIPDQMTTATFQAPMVGPMAEIALSRLGQPLSTEAEHTYALCWIAGGSGALELDNDGAPNDPFFALGDRTLSDWVRLGLRALHTKAAASHGFTDWLRVVPHLDALPTESVLPLMMSLDFEPARGSHSQGMRRANCVAHARHAAALEALADYRTERIEVTDKPQMSMAFETLRIAIQSKVGRRVSDEQYGWIRENLGDFVWGDHNEEGPLHLLPDALGPERMNALLDDWLGGDLAGLYIGTWKRVHSITPPARRTEVLDLAWAALDDKRRWWDSELQLITDFPDVFGPRVLAMVTAASDPKSLREGTIPALGGLPQPEAAELLVSLLEGSPPVKRLAIQALRQQDQRAHAALTAGMAHKKRGVRNVCEALLSRLQPTPMDSAKAAVTDAQWAAAATWAEWSLTAIDDGTRLQLADLLVALVEEHGVSILPALTEPLGTDISIRTTLPRLLSQPAVRAAPFTPWLVAELCTKADHFMRDRIEGQDLAALFEETVEHPLAPAFAHMLRTHSTASKPLLIDILSDQVHRHPEAFPLEDFIDVLSESLIGKGDVAEAARIGLVLQGERVRPAMTQLAAEKSKAKRAAGEAVLAGLDSAQAG